MFNCLSYVYQRDPKGNSGDKILGNFCCCKTLWVAQKSSFAQGFVVTSLTLDQQNSESQFPFFGATQFFLQFFGAFPSDAIGLIKLNLWCFCHWIIGSAMITLRCHHPLMGLSWCEHGHKMNCSCDDQIKYMHIHVYKQYYHHSNNIPVCTYNVGSTRQLSWFITPKTMVYGAYDYSFWG